LRNTHSQKKVGNRLPLIFDLLEKENRKWKVGNGYVLGVDNSIEGGSVISDVTVQNSRCHVVLDGIES